MHSVIYRFQQYCMTSINRGISNGTRMWCLYDDMVFMSHIWHECEQSSIWSIRCICYCSYIANRMVLSRVLTRNYLKCISACDSHVSRTWLIKYIGLSHMVTFQPRARCSWTAEPLSPVTAHCGPHRRWIPLPPPAENGPRRRRRKLCMWGAAESAAIQELRLRLRLRLRCTMYYMFNVEGMH